MEPVLSLQSVPAPNQDEDLITSGSSDGTLVETTVLSTAGSDSFPPEGSGKDRFMVSERSTMTAVDCDDDTQMCSCDDDIVPNSSQTSRREPDIDFSRALNIMKNRILKAKNRILKARSRDKERARARAVKELSGGMSRLKLSSRRHDMDRTV
eukprot:jgi/Botrbrau1/2147/Bobra.0093s0052.1